MLIGGVISIDSKRMNGVPVFNGSRVTIETLVDHIQADGVTLEDFFEGFPEITKEQVSKVLDLLHENPS